MSRTGADIRFGIRSNQQRSYYWRVRAGGRLPELFVERENLAASMHISLHASGQWHMKFRRKQVVQWGRPNELVPGIIRALVIIQPTAVATISLPAFRGTRLLPVVENSHPVHFNIFIEGPGVHPLDWPGRASMKTSLVGRIPLAQGAGSCSVVSHQRPIAPVASRFEKPNDGELAQMKQAIEQNQLFGTIFGHQADGTFTLLDGRFVSDC
jgi:hypothetical protein